ncbi:segregation/condensation protein A [bacterium]|nr:segregation/condensation protein A [bacterium]
MNDQEYKVKLDAFEGPLDLLLFLIKEQEVDIYDIPIVNILDQYMEYLNLMKQLDLAIAGEFIVMAASLMYIKSKMLLPPAPKGEEDNVEDPRTELVNQLLEYQKIKEAASLLENLEIKQKEVFQRSFNINTISLPEIEETQSFNLYDLMKAFSKVLKESESKNFVREILCEEVTVEDKIADIIEALKICNRIKFEDLFEKAYTKIEIIVTFLAVLEMIKSKEIKVVQEESFGVFYIERPRDEVRGTKYEGRF